MGTVLEGVANFRSFQREARTFFEEERAFQRGTIIRHDAEIKHQEALATALKERDEAAVKESDQREKKADRWWKRILTWLLIVGSMISLIELTRPVLQRWLHIPEATVNMTPASK
jgi:hypothetical protein